MRKKNGLVMVCHEAGRQGAKALRRQECPVQDAKALKDQPPSQMIILHPPVLII
jgi:hypothetical protein